MKALGLIGMVFGLAGAAPAAAGHPARAPPAACTSFWGRGNLEYIIEDMWVGLDKEVILSIPLFILCGNVMTRGSIAQRLIRILAAITKPLPGGLAVASILSCAVFAAISGSSIVTMLAIGTVMYPAMRQAGYDNKFSLGAIMSGGTLGIIIPPSIPMIIYGLVTETVGHRPVRRGLRPGHPAHHRAVGLFGLVQPAHADGALRPRRVLDRLQGGHLGGDDAGDPARRHLLAATSRPPRPPPWRSATRSLVEIFMHRELKAGDFYDVVLETSKLGGSLFPAARRGAQPQHHPDRAPRAAGAGRLHAGLHLEPADVHAAGQHPAADRRLPDDHRRGDPGAGAAAGAARRRLRLRQGAVRPDHDPQPGDRLPDAAGGPQPDRRHERLQAAASACCAGPPSPSSC